MHKQILTAILIFFTLIQTTQAAQHAMVVTDQHLATDVGVSILKQGGNAIDAAVAVGYALAVVDPCCGNIGGGGFMTLHLANNQNIIINFRERAPLTAQKDMFLDKNGNIIPNKSNHGYTSVATPGTVMGLEYALKKYGTLPRERIMSPAIELAEKGFTLTPGDIKILTQNTNELKKQANVAAIFLKNGRPYKVGDRLVQTDLANSLKQIAEQGSDAFYQGDIANTIVQASQDHGGLLSLIDFVDYSVETMKPITCTYHGYTIISAPPPSSGGIALCEMLNILELDQLKNHSAQSTHDIVEAMRYAFYDRNNQISDPDFVKVDVSSLTSKAYAKKIHDKIPEFKASTSLPSITPTTEGQHTTHYSIVDSAGNAVSVTYTLNSLFGAAIIAGDTGILLNNSMDDFSKKPGSTNQFGLVENKNNLVQPGKRPLSSMTPTILLDKNKVLMVIGSPGGPRIITSTLLTILNVLDFKMDIQSAVNARRYHHQWLPDSIDIEANAFTPSLQKDLTQRGYRFTPQADWGAVEAIYIAPNSHIIEGANDKRRPAGLALGY